MPIVFSTVRFFSSVFCSVRFGPRFGSVRESANRYFFELICGLIYSVLIVQKSANRTENRIEANQKPINTGEPKVLRINSAGQFSNSLTEPKFELKRTENREVNRSFSIQTPNNRTEPNRKKNESLRKLYFTTQFSLHFEFRFFHRFGSVRRVPNR